MTAPLPWPSPPPGQREDTGQVAVSAEWLRLARLARLLSWLTLAWMGVEGGVAIFAAVVAGSVALLGFGLDSGIEAMASVIVIWRFTGSRLASATSERRAQQLVAVSFFLLAPYIAVEAIRALAAGDRAETSIAGLVLTAGTAVFEPALGLAKRRIGARLGSSATAGEGTQNLLCACLAMAVFVGLAANTRLGAWWLDGVVALGIAGWAVVQGRRAWTGRSCGCAMPAGVWARARSRCDVGVVASGSSRPDAARPAPWSPDLDG
jgi:divalent metal cation (Fe/Co/Zn/Cd) transporter